MSDPSNHSEYLAPGEFIDSDHPSVKSFARKTGGAEGTDVARVLRLFHAIRDDIRYDPYVPMSQKEHFNASHCLQAGRGWCVTKAALLAACARAIGVPARCGYADVRNHLATPRLLKLLGTDIFYWHSFCDLLLDGKWVKATPAFNKSLCDKFGLRPLEFDGRHDSLFHEFDREGKRHMEYIRFRGTYNDVPYAEIIATFAREYPDADDGLEGDFETEAGQA